ncbi:C2 family cysteine protease [Nonomuraea sp. NPDC050556]|uniref:C2 family cysteine protease n=1 Tax=Nonomuraea sp. NPDC050556 TaxID=3364369 RepID=UPI00379078BA
MAPEPQQEFAGIDPVQLKKMIGDLSDAAQMVNARMSRLRDDFGRAGIDAKHITRLEGVRDWIQGELPMLRRRQTMTEQISKENNQYGFNGPMVESEWEGYFKSPEEAQAKAKELAKQYKKPGELPPGVWEEIRKYQFDPDFAEAFARELGPDKLGWLAGRATNPESWGDDDENTEGRFTAIANILAVASHRGIIDDAWLKGFDATGRGTDYNLLADLMMHGTWSKEAVAKIVNAGLGENGTSSPQTMAALLDAAARNPFAANEIYSKNFDRINGMVSGNAWGWTGVKDGKMGDPLARFVKAATLDAHENYERMRQPGNATWQNPAEPLMARILGLTQTKRGFTSPVGGVQQTLNVIVSTYGEKLTVPNPQIDVGDGFTYEPASVPPLDPKVPVDWEMVKQGGVGDCWFLAGVIGELKRDPNFLAKRMTLNPDGTYTVTFFRDGKPVKIKIDGQTMDRGAQPPLVNIFEKAFAQFRGNGRYRGTEGDSEYIPDIGEYFSPNRWRDGHVLRPWEDLNGKDRPMMDGDDITFDKLKALVDKNVPMTMSVPNGYNADGRTGPGEKLVSDHVYVIEKVFKDPSGKEMVLLSNPWGPHAGADQKVEIPLKWIQDRVHGTIPLLERVEVSGEER